MSRFLLFSALAVCGLVGLTSCGSGRKAALGGEPYLVGVYTRSYDHGPIFLTLDVRRGRGDFYHVHHGMAGAFSFGLATVRGDTLFLASDPSALDRLRPPPCDTIRVYPDRLIMGCVSAVEEAFFESRDTLLIRGRLLFYPGREEPFRLVGGPRYGQGR